MLPLSAFDRVALGGAGAAFALYLGALAWTSRGAAGPRWLGRTLCGVLLLLALDVQLAVLLLLLGADGTQDGILAGDVRLRNALGATFSAAIWMGALVRWIARRRRVVAAPAGSARPSSR